MELDLQETKYKSKKTQVDRLSKILEEVIQLSNSNDKMTKDEVSKMVKYFESQINE